MIIYTFRFEHYFIEQMIQKKKSMTKGGGWDPLPPTLDPHMNRPIHVTAMKRHRTL